MSIAISNDFGMSKKLIPAEKYIEMKINLYLLGKVCNLKTLSRSPTAVLRNMQIKNIPSLFQYYILGTFHSTLFEQVGLFYSFSVQAEYMLIHVTPFDDVSSNGLK